MISFLAIFWKKKYFSGKFRPFLVIFSLFQPFLQFWTIFSPIIYDSPLSLQFPPTHPNQRQLHLDHSLLLLKFNLRHNRERRRHLTPLRARTTHQHQAKTSIKFQQHCIPLSATSGPCAPFERRRFHKGTFESGHGRWCGMWNGLWWKYHGKREKVHQIFAPFDFCGAFGGFSATDYRGFADCDLFVFDELLWDVFGVLQVFFEEFWV